MSQESNNAQDIAYSREGQIVAHFRTLAERKDMTGEEASQAITDFCSHYQRLVEDSKLLTSVGDRLQRKLKSANLMLREQSDEIKRINGEVQKKNAELQETIDELTRAKVSRRATTLLLLVAIGLFLLSEIPESYIENYFSQYSWGGVMTWGIKVALALLLAPIQSLIEVRLLKQVAKQKKQAQEEAGAQPQAPAAPVDLASKVTPAVVPSATAGEAGAAAMSVAARKKAEAAARRAAESNGTAPDAPAVAQAVATPATESHGDASMASMSVAARKKAEAAARKAAAEAAATVEATQQQS